MMDQNKLKNIKLFSQAAIDKNKYVLRDRWYKEEDGWV